VNQHNVVSDGRAEFFVDIYGLKEIGSYITERLLGPWEEPINASVADESREVTATDTEGFTCGRHAQNNVHVLTAAVNKVLPTEFFGLRKFLFSDFLIKGAHKSFLFFISKETRDHSNSENIVYKLKETFLGDVSVGEHEGTLGNHNFLVEILEVHLEVILFVVTDQVNGPGLVAGNESG
jgi:hypothetical protein